MGCISISHLTFHIQDINKPYYNFLPSFIYLPSIIFSLPFNLMKMLSLSSRSSHARTALHRHHFPSHFEVPARLLLPRQPSHRTFTNSLYRQKVPNEERKTRFRCFTLARLGWTSGIVTVGGVLFAGVELYLYKKEAREIWDSVKRPVLKAWEVVKWPFRKGKDAWAGWRERKNYGKTKNGQKESITRWSNTRKRSRPMQSGWIL